MYENTRVTDIIARVGAYLRQPLSIHKSELIKALTALESLRIDLLEVSVDWQEMLAEKKAQYLMPKDKDWTELDRKTRLNAQLANIERDAEFLAGLQVIVQERIKLGSILLQNLED